MEVNVLIRMSVNLVSITVTRTQNVPIKLAVSLVHVKKASREMELSVRQSVLLKLMIVIPMQFVRKRGLSVVLGAFANLVSSEMGSLVLI